MPKVKANVKRLQNLRNSSKRTPAEENIDTVAAEARDVDLLSILPIPSAFDRLKWNKATEEKVNKYRHGISVSKRHEQRQRANNRRNAEGSERVTNFFTSPTFVEEQKEDQVEKSFSIEALSTALESLTSQIDLSMSRDSSHQKAGSSEYTRLLAVRKYLDLRVNSTMPAMKASIETSKSFWPASPIAYRSRKIREDAQEFIENKFLCPSKQGKHAKRFPVLNDNDIK